MVMEPESITPISPPKLSPSPFPNSPTASTATTVHHSSSSQALQPSPKRYPSSSHDNRDDRSDKSWQSSSSLETATAIPQPAFSAQSASASAVRLTLTKPLTLQIRSQSSQSLSHSRDSSPPGSSPTGTLTNARLQEAVQDGQEESAGMEEEKERTIPSISFSIGSHGTNPLGSNPPNLKNTARYSVVSVTITAGPMHDEGKRRERSSNLRQRWGRIKGRLASCFRGVDN